jgi:hypothetical protein
MAWETARLRPTPRTRDCGDPGEACSPFSEVLGQRRRVPEPFGAPLDNLGHLQACNGGEIRFGVVADAITLGKVEPQASGKDDKHRAGKSRDQPCGDSSSVPSQAPPPDAPLPDIGNETKVIIRLAAAQGKQKVAPERVRGVGRSLTCLLP